MLYTKFSFNNTTWRFEQKKLGESLFGGHRHLPEFIILPVDHSTGTVDRKKKNFSHQPPEALALLTNGFFFPAKH